jgi:hypothetical protein
LHSTCLHARLYTESGADRHIRAAIREINGILAKLEEQYAGPNRELAFLVVSDDAGDDVLTLDWIHVDKEVTTVYDGTRLEANDVHMS